MWWWTILVVLCASALNSASEGKGDGEWRTVGTAQGPVRGRKGSTGDYYEFYNLRYATAPTGKDRFKAPRPPPARLAVFDAVDEGIACPQASLGTLPPTLKQQEDCLIANVYVPDTEEKDLPVLVYVHGGAFQIGYGNLFEFKNLVRTKRIIVVTFNYRLGIHGFLCLGTDDAPGNAGMKDQVALLRWVNENIASFGGNPKDVTIAGYSAGSTSVAHIMLSKSAEGLFNKVIPESGTSAGGAAVQLDPVENAKAHARSLNFTNVDDIYALEEFYKTASFDVLTSESFYDRTDSTFIFTPCVERNNSEDVFLEDFPVNIIKKGNYKKVPLLYGITNMEGLLRMEFFELWKDAMNEKFSDFLSADLQFKNEDEKKEVAKKIKQFYFGDKPVDETTVLNYINYFSDVLFVYPTLREVKLYVESSHDQIYLYEYSFVDDDTPVVPYTDIRGAAHVAQTYAIADGANATNIDESALSEQYKNMKKIMRDIWFNFVSTSKPIPVGSSLPMWPAVGANRSPHMSLGQVVELKGPLLEERARFWDEIYEKYYRHPVPPPIHPLRPHPEL